MSKLRPREVQMHWEARAAFGTRSPGSRACGSGPSAAQTAATGSLRGKAELQAEGRSGAHGTRIYTSLRAAPSSKILQALQVCQNQCQDWGATNSHLVGGTSPPFGGILCPMENHLQMTISFPAVTTVQFDHFSRKRISSSTHVIQPHSLGEQAGRLRSEAWIYLSPVWGSLLGP